MGQKGRRLRRSPSFFFALLGLWGTHPDPHRTTRRSAYPGTHQKGKKKMFPNREFRVRGLGSRHEQGNSNRLGTRI